MVKIHCPTPGEMNMLNLLDSSLLSSEQQSATKLSLIMNLVRMSDEQMDSSIDFLNKHAFQLDMNMFANAACESIDERFF